VTQPSQPSPAGETVTVVSGLPRSGTSLMMQMLDAGGMPVLTDHVRGADEDNPRGYYEFEPVKRTKQDPSWLQRAGGHVVKMVHVLLYDLPADGSTRYRVILMRRDLGEVIASQKRMLERTGAAGAKLTDDELRSAYERQLGMLGDWLTDQTVFDVVEVSYNDLIRDPGTVASQVNGFVGGELDEEAMRNVVDPSLYRQRQAAGSAS
jgi:hypothetical protein